MDLDTDTDTDIDHELATHWHSLRVQPRLIVFDLDYTLWPFFLDKHIPQPTTRRQTPRGIELVDKHGNGQLAYRDVTKLLRTLKACVAHNGHLAVASKSPNATNALVAIGTYGWSDLFSSVQIYNRSKNHHMVEIKRELGLDDLEMALFFDDNEKNVAPAASLGVFVYLVGEDGLSRKAVFQGLSQFEESKLKAVLNEP